MNINQTLLNGTYDVGNIEEWLFMVISPILFLGALIILGAILIIWRIKQK